MTTSKIEWCTRSDWNPIRGCTRVSPGCGGPGKQGGCYAEAMAARFSKPGQWGHGFAEMRNHEPRWTGKVELQEDRVTLPLSWKKPAHIFVSSTSDVFHEALPDEAIDKLFAVMALCPQHTFQVLTKRAERMREYQCDPHTPDRQARINAKMIAGFGPDACKSLGVTWNKLRPWPLPNIWLGVSAEDQQRADERREPLKTLADARWTTFVSYEPALGPVDWTGWEFLKWLISGGESGPHARPSHPDWHRVARDWCAAHGVAFFFKQWGEHIAGKRAAGRLLDGIEHNAMPEPRSHVEDAA